MNYDDNNIDLKAADQEIGFAVLIRGELKGEPFWAYASILPSRYEEFLNVIQREEPYILTEYGEILEYKLGETEPTDEVKARIEETYGIDHGFEDQVKEMAENMIPPSAL